MTAPQKLLSPEEIAVRAGEQLVHLHLPEPGVFAARALRLRQLAAGHAMRDYLLFLAELAEAQHRQSVVATPVQCPTQDQIEAAANAGLPLLPAETWPRDAAWRDGLRALLRDLATHLAAGPAKETVERLAGATDEHLEVQAARLLSGVMLGLDLASAPLVAAGLQLHWARLVWQTEAGADSKLAPFGRIDSQVICPCCGSRPVAGITRLGAEGSGARYLACGLCATQWHYVRIKCSHCEGTKGISLQSLLLAGESEGDAKRGEPAVEVECCGECGHYLKLVHQERDHDVEPVADDLASLTLDLLVAESDLQRVGANLLLLFGDPDEQPTPERAS
jgi:FdhE protein